MGRFWFTAKKCAFSAICGYWAIIRPKSPFFLSPRDFTLSQRGFAPFLLRLRIMRNEGPIPINAAYTQPRRIDAHYAHERAIALLKGFLAL